MMSSSPPETDEHLELQLKLDKIRSQINSKLPNQQQLALILQTIEENLDQQHQTATPTAYFVSFISLLDQCCQNDEVKDYELATGALYLLSMVSPFTPKVLLRPHFAELLTKVAPVLTDSRAKAPLVRSGIHFLESLLAAQNRSAWSNVHSYKISPNRGFKGLLELALDHRPKVRKAAQEAIHNILTDVPAGSVKEHPASHTAAGFALENLITVMQDKGNIRNSLKEKNADVVHSLQLISSISTANAWPSDQVKQLCDILLQLCKSADEFMVSSAFEVFDSLFSSMNGEIDEARFNDVLNVLLDLKPSYNDSNLAPVWLTVVAKGITTYSHDISSISCFMRLPHLFKIIGSYLKSQSKDVYVSASQCIIAICSGGIDPNVLLSPPANTQEVNNNVDKVINDLSQITNDFLSVKYRHCAKEVAEIMEAIFLALKFRATSSFNAQLELIGGWRSDEKEGFDLNDSSERVIGAAISSIGPKAVLNCLPLNLDNPNAIGRAWLLPILRDHVKCSYLGFYIKEVLPYVDYFGELIKHGKSKSMNSKIFATIIDQLWSILPAFCDLPRDGVESFTDDFAANLSQLLYKKTTLRPVICHALRILVESNLTYVSGTVADPTLNQVFPVEKSKEVLEYLAKTKSSNILSVLFNVFSETPSEQRGYILETIDAYLHISSPDDVVSAFNNVCTLLKRCLDEENFAEPSKQDVDESGTIPPVAVTMMDIIIEMVQFIPVSSQNTVLTIFNQTVSTKSIPTQKRAYRILERLLTLKSGQETALKFLPDILRVLKDASETTLTPVKSARLNCIGAVLAILPPSCLYFIPAVISDVILGTKNANESARETSYDILVLMAQKMKDDEGSTIKNSVLDPDIPDSEASLKEFFVMCSAGLAGGTPHMISATVTALARIFYEFHSDLPVDFLAELTSTIELFLTSKNREIIKSTLGFVKVSTLTLPSEYVKPGLKGLLTNVMNVNHEQKGHFRSKIKHLIERLVRKYGIDYITECIPEEDQKLIANIRKTNARTKRKKAESSNGNRKNDDEHTGDRQNFMSGYDEALYGDTEDESDDNEDKAASGVSGNGNIEQFISESRDIPLDLLDKQALSHISSTRPKKLSKKVRDIPTENGKLVFNEDDDAGLSSKNSIDAYVEAIKQAPVRTRGNKLRYRKKQRKEDGINWDEDADTDTDVVNSKRTRHSKVRGGRINKLKPKFKARKKL